MGIDIGIIGGSGFYSLIENAEEVEMTTEYGHPSDKVSIGTINGKSIAFIPRHGKKHTYPPHKVPYKANIEALSKLGVKRIITTVAVGSLKEEYAPGDFVFIDQFVNMTWGRDDTFFHSNPVIHISPADPYCSELRALASSESKNLNIKHHDNGTVVVVNGPRFSTRAESKFFKNQGFDIINMTQYPEVALAKEKGICYLGIGIVTDYDAGLENKDIKPVNATDVLKVFEKNVSTAKNLITELISKVPENKSCNCSKALEEATGTPK
ncbi:MAG: S-methyl-5'-thioadenosine phosphorylase [Candidatus Marsarchaeota archaeon]|jgi:5'-methylthioadenosine phosphorylase|nr:S-methyl-5'-thioadenosine phosphorylase [Candidatus Marsarchaeota archaeon]